MINQWVKFLCRARARYMHSLQVSLYRLLGIAREKKVTTQWSNWTIPWPGDQS